MILGNVWVRAAVTLAGIGAGCAAALVYLPRNEALPMAVAMGAAALLLGWGLGLPAPDRPADPGVPLFAEGRWKRTLALALAGAVLVGIGLAFFSRKLPRNDLGWIFHFAGVASFVAAFWPHRGAPEERRVARWEWAALLLILAVGAAFRLHRVTTQPYGIWFDEAQNVLEAEKILLTPSYWPVFVADVSQMPALYFYSLTPFVKLVGTNVMAARAAATLMGLAALVAVWALGRRLYGPEAALFAAALLAVCRWHLHFSRFGIANIFAPLIIPLVFWLLRRSQDRGSAREAVFAGVALGLGMQLYYALLTLPALVALHGAHVVVMRRGQARRLAGLLALTLVAAGLTYAPVLLYARQHRPEFLQRMRNVSLFETGGLGETVKLFATPGPERDRAVTALRSNIRKHAGMFHLIGDPNGRHNLPGTRMLERALGVLFVIGLLWCLARFWEPRSALMLIWFFAMLSAGILSLDFEAPQAARSFGITSAIALLGALPLARLWQAFPIPVVGLWIGRAAALALLVANAAEARRVYFKEYLWDTSSFEYWSTPQTRIGHVVAAEGAGAKLYLPATLIGGPTEALLVGGPLVAEAFDPAKHIPLIEPRKTIIFLLGDDAVTAHRLREIYPRASIEPFGAPRPDGKQAHPILWTARISADDIAALRGWSLQMRSTPSSAETVVPSTSTEWRWDSTPVTPPFTATVDGNLRVAVHGRYELQLQSPDAATLTVDGTQVLARPGRVALRLAEGLHQVKLSMKVPPARGVSRLTWKRPEGAADELIPPESLILPRLATGGLLGRYYKGTQCGGEPAALKVDPQVAFYFHLLPLERPFSICWSGWMRVPQAGTYTLGTRSIDLSSVLLDGNEVVSNPGPDVSFVSKTLPLTAGWHPVQVRYDAINNGSQIYLRWIPPGGREPANVPMENLRPEPPEVLAPGP